jgi:ribosomal-protein-alanine N-acetyltransferase
MITERLIIDSIRETDAEDYFVNISHDRKVLETFICQYAETPEELDLSRYTGRDDLFAIRLKESGRLIGIILYFDEKDNSCEIGYGIGSRYWNQGYATEAIGRFLDYLFWKKNIRTVYASFFTGNDASRRVMEKCCMSYSHFVKEELTYLGVHRDLTYYVIHRPASMTAYCGVDCSACEDYVNGKCPSCKLTDWDEADVCMPVECCRQKGIAYCAHCADFPCRSMSEFYDESDSHREAYQRMIEMR